MCWHSIWLSSGKPTTGWVREIQRRTRAQYHKVVKELKKNGTLSRNEKMADAIIPNTMGTFGEKPEKIILK